ncbi:MAG: hypothetical protein HOP29_02020 [Phycisphaerales bacterium]|nr:hypothetical protein [Phycisphaerales bacterium]
MGSDRVIESNHSCWRCEYNLRGLTTDGRCPECGELIDVSRKPFSGRVWVIEFFWTLVPVVLVILTIVVDIAFPLTGFWQVPVGVLLVGALAAWMHWRVRQRRTPFIALLLLALMLAVLHYAPTNRKLFVRFYQSLRNDMTQTEVIAQLDRYFPSRAANGWPRIMKQTPDMLIAVLDGPNGRYNAEVVWVGFVAGRVGSKIWSPD